MTKTEISHLLQQGMLDEAEKLAASCVKEAVTDESIRALYIEILCVQGQFEKADQQLTALSTLKPELSLTLGIWRQLVKAAQMRVDVFDLKAKPDVVDEPSQTIKQALQLLVALKENNTEQIATLLESVNQQAEKEININQSQYSLFRDLDDISANFIEVFSSQGKYFWIEPSQILSLELHAPSRLIDVIWRPASIVIANGSEGEVFIPSIYPSQGDNFAQLGRKTDWEIQQGVYRGVGLKTWLAGDEEINFNALESLITTPSHIPESV